MSHSTSSATSALHVGRQALDFQLSLPTLWDWKMKAGGENGGWMLAQCPVLFLLNLPSAPPPRLCSPTLLISLICHYFSISFFLPTHSLFSHPPLHLFFWHISTALDLHKSKHMAARNSGKVPKNWFSVPRRGQVTLACLLICHV